MIAGSKRAVEYRCKNVSSLFLSNESVPNVRKYYFLEMINSTFVYCFKIHIAGGANLAACYGHSSFLVGLPVFLQMVLE